MRAGSRTAIAIASVLALVLSSMALGEPSSSELTLSCALVQTITGTHGAVRQARRAQVIKLGPGVYRVWSPSIGWGENHCAFTPCQFAGNLFSYRIDTRSSEGGYILRRFEEVAFDRASGLLDSEEENSTTIAVTGLEKETTIYEHGHCEATSDPGA
jgi:hypothetical protein